ncbi:NAD(P)H-dependent FMN reductase [Parvibaculum indicum]|uniref:NADPH-dependent FMN reductase n=1 Tax=Parvibaculum indicum TaxID=562969 RepID=UPI001421CE57|nr:NAD(P)H-dependent oxidoreductase [Parvibaculum indicum]NIJ42972.1 NAD(P)H-dependent FMN reductase [Parvibaculum indicum]
MKIAVISGSQRPNSQSLKVARYLEERVAGLCEGSSVYLLELGTGPLPLWDQSMFTGDPSPLKEAWAPISAALTEADAIVVVTPEWHGMVPPALKNFLLMCSKELANKPGLIVSVSASLGGSYPVVELRTSGYKNNRICWIPDHVIIRNVSKMLNGDPASEEEKTVVGRCDHALRILVEYGKALRAVRESGVADYDTYAFGM